jgi:TadE-like protein
MRGSMSPSRGSGKKWGLTLKRTCADKTRMRSSWDPGAASAEATAGVPARPRESGQALIEFALIAPLFLLLVVGIIQFGIGLNYWLDLNRIANQGARWAVVDKYPNCSGSTTDPGCISPTLVEHLESEPISGGLQPTAEICFEESAAGAVGEPLTVRVESDFTFLPIMNLGTITLRGKATMRIEQSPAVMNSQGVDQCT